MALCYIHSEIIIKKINSIIVVAEEPLNYTLEQLKKRILKHRGALRSHMISQNRSSSISNPGENSNRKDSLV
uniref:Uncharacterized protein n=1 Tax=Arundo donax TaxID=35708 RepID=A0A0A9CXB8_ARUDO